MESANLEKKKSRSDGKCWIFTLTPEEIESQQETGPIVLDFSDIRKKQTSFGLGVEIEKNEKPEEKKHSGSEDDNPIEPKQAPMKESALDALARKWDNQEHYGYDGEDSFIDDDSEV
jgi:hypothetical protein